MFRYSTLRRVFNCCYLRFILFKGDVSDDCACIPSFFQTTRMTTDIQNWCSNLDRQNCDFYKHCLQWRQSCNDSGYSYAIGIEENICKLYENYAQKFTSTGQQWLNALRKCFQVEHVLSFIQYEYQTCDDMKDSAFLSHHKCYDDHGYDFIAPSMCDVSFRERFQVVVTAKSALDWETWKRCDLQLNEDTFYEGLEMFVNCPTVLSDITTLKIAFSTNVRTSVINSVITIAFQIECFLKSRYETDDLLIYPLIFDSTGYMGTANVVIAQRSEFDLNFQQGKYVDIDKAVNDLLDNVSSGKFLPKLPNGVEIVSYSLCDEIWCLNPNRVV